MKKILFVILVLFCNHIQAQYGIRIYNNTISTYKQNGVLTWSTSSPSFYYNEFDSTYNFYVNGNREILYRRNLKVISINGISYNNIKANALSDSLENVVRLYNNGGGSSGGSGSGTATILNNISFNSTISWEKISGYIPVSGQSVDYMFGKWKRYTEF